MDARISLDEWSKADSSYRLTDADRELVLRIADRIRITELREGISIASTSYVGLIQLAGLGINIKPKLSGDHSGLLDLLEFIGTGDVRFFNSEAKLQPSGSTLLEFFVRLFLLECMQIVKAGVRFGYNRQFGALHTLRGRLLIREQFISKRDINANVYCDYDDFSADIIENRVIRSVIMVCQRFARNNAELSRSLTRLRGIFDDACGLLDISPEAARQCIVYNRLNDHYRKAHMLGWLILAGLGITDFSETGAAPVYSFLVDMNHLFETFVTRIVTLLFPRPDNAVQSQMPALTSFRDVEFDKLFAQIVPDLYIIETKPSGNSLPVDAKYKRYDSGNVISSDLYQLSIYALDARPISDQYRSALIYPSEFPEGVSRRIRLRGKAHVPTIDVYVLGIHIPTLLADYLRHRMRDGQAAWLRRSLISALNCL